MDIAIVYPEVLDMARYRERRKEFPPFGALYIAAVLEEEGHSVSIIRLHPDKLTYDLDSFDAVAMSISASATFNMFMEFRYSSKFKKGALIMAGGVHANLYPEQTLLDLTPHVVGVGEGEDTVKEIVAIWPSTDFSKIDGVCFLRSGKPFRTSPRIPTRDIERFPLPARHLLPVDDFIMSDRMSNTNIRMTHIVPGRGCPFPCRYCASAQTRVQYRSGANVRHELVQLIRDYSIEGFAVVGNDFILSHKNVSDICSNISDLNLKWATLSRVDRVDESILKEMKSAGCYEIEFGIESGSARILEAMSKGASLDQAERALRISHATGIKNKVFLIHGFPGEDQDSTSETIRFLDKVGHLIERVSLFRFVPLPGTYAHNHPSQYGIKGTYGSPDWDGNWGKFHVHHNHHHWWGDKADFERLTVEFWRLHSYVESRWTSRFSLAELPEDQWQKQSQTLAKKFAKMSQSTLESIYGKKV